MVKLFTIAGRALAIVIVPLPLKMIVSTPVPSAQSPPVMSVPGAFALLIASRRLHRPSPAVLASLVVFTVIVDELFALRVG